MLKYKNAGCYHIWNPTHIYLTSQSFFAEVHVRKCWYSSIVFFFTQEKTATQRGLLVYQKLKLTGGRDRHQNQGLLNPIQCFSYYKTLFIYSSSLILSKRIKENIGGKFPEFMNLVLNCSLISCDVSERNIFIRSKIIQ